jgi:hypothetical protein
MEAQDKFCVRSAPVIEISFSVSSSLRLKESNKYQPEVDFKLRAVNDERELLIALTSEEARTISQRLLLAATTAEKMATEE